MKLGTFKKVLLTVMGVGVVGSLVSVGTFATFTATTTNPGNTFAAGTINLTTTIPTNLISANSNISSAANVNSVSNTLSNVTDLGTNTTCSNKIASSCGTIVASTRVTSEGLEPGQYVFGKITITNAGTLPALFSVMPEQLVSQAAAAAGNVCPADIAGTGLTQAVSTVNTTNGLGACQPLGKALNISIHDDTKGTCIFGLGDVGTAGTATGAPDAHTIAQTGNCDTLTSGADLSTAGGRVPNDAFGDGTTAANTFGQFQNTAIYVPGNSDTSASVNGGSASRWAPGESHTFTVTLAFPDQGAVTGTIGSDNVSVGVDTVYQGGKISFDLVWLATQ